MSIMNALFKNTDLVLPQVKEQLRKVLNMLLWFTKTHIRNAFQNKQN